MQPVRVSHWILQPSGICFFVAASAWLNFSCVLSWCVILFLGVCGGRSRLIIYCFRRQRYGNLFVPCNWVGHKAGSVGRNAVRRSGTGAGLWRGAASVHISLRMTVLCAHRSVGYAPEWGVSKGVSWLKNGLRDSELGVLERVGICLRASGLWCFITLCVSVCCGVIWGWVRGCPFGFLGMVVSLQCIKRIIYGKG